MLEPHEIRLKFWFTVLQKHFNDFLKVGMQFVQCFALSVGSRKPRNITNKKTSAGAPLHDC